MRICSNEWKAFWEAIGGDWYHDDDDVPEDADTAPFFEVTCGTLLFQGKCAWDTRGVFNRAELDDQCASLLTVFRRWKKQQTVTTLVIEGDKDKVADVTAAVKAAGWRVVK